MVAASELPSSAMRPPRLEYIETPNPHALKCVVHSDGETDAGDGTGAPPASGGVPGPTRSFRTSAEAASSTLAGAIFRVPGVTSVLLGHGWFTVNKDPAQSWGSIKKGLAQAVALAGTAELAGNLHPGSSSRERA